MTQVPAYVPEPGEDPAFDNAVQILYESVMWRLKDGTCVNGSWLFALGWFEEGELQQTFEGCGCRTSRCATEPYAVMPPAPPDEHWHNMESSCFASDASVCRDRSVRAPQTGSRLP